MEINNEITIQLATYTSLDLEMFLIVLGYLLTFEIWQVLIPPLPLFFWGGGGQCLDDIFGDCLTHFLTG